LTLSSEGIKPIALVEMASKKKEEKKKTSAAAVAAPSDRGLSVTSQVFLDLDAVKELPATGLFIKVICDFLECTWISEVRHPK
jgi:hypothetical protein